MGMRKRNFKVALTLSLGLALLAGGTNTTLALEKNNSKTSLEQKATNANIEKVQLDNGLIINSKEMGNGEATIVFDTGYGESLDNFSYIQEQLSKTAKTLSYDRAGLGGSSDAGNLAPLSEENKEILMNGGTIDYNENDFNGLTKTAKDKAINLYKLLKAKNIPGPYILVGHSLGGHTAIEFAKMYTEEVEGVVFLDGSARSVTGEGYRFFNEFVPGMGDDFIAGYTKADGTLDDVLMSENQVKDDKNALRNTPLFYIECDPYAMAQGPMGDAFAKLKTNQIADILSMSDDTQHIQLKGATHYVHIDKPEETLKAITEFVDYCKAKN
ncbi:alpha/beta fold hydrolase [Paraclostridium bifermentans]|uniref:alpha/beta fold hydrolase n=1 Tax=Paraclostridium bifermentans TaxID=1490 RepID=UPI00359C2316